MKLTMTDKEFDDMLEDDSANTIVFCGLYSFTPDQITKLCKLSLLDKVGPASLLKMELSKEQIDILLTTNNEYTLHQMFVCGVKMMTPDQINVGLSHKMQCIRSAAYEHPSCTDEQKIAYHLKWGMTDPIGRYGIY